MENRNLLNILTSILVLSSCQYNNEYGCEKILISKSEKEWLKFYEHTSTIIYVSNKDNFDTLIVERLGTADYSPCNRFELGTNQYETISVLLKKKHNWDSKNPTNNKAWFNFSKDVLNKDSDSSNKHLRVFDYHITNFSSLSDYPIQDVNLSSTTKTYKAHYFNRTGRTKNNDGTPIHITSFYWSKSDGLIKYITSDGEEFEFLKKL